MRLSVLHQSFQLLHSVPDLVGTERHQLLYDAVYYYQISSMIAYLQITSLLVHLGFNNFSPQHAHPTITLTLQRF